MDELIERIERAAEALRDLRPGIEAGEPWPLSTDFGTAPESTWGPREALAHVAEMLPFWTGEIARVVVTGAPQPVPFGRVQSDVLRIGVLERDRTLPLGELFERIDAGTDRIAGRLEAISPADAARRGVHPRLGELTATEIAERLVVGHLEEHVQQLRDLVATRGA